MARFQQFPDEVFPPRPLESDLGSRSAFTSRSDWTESSDLAERKRLQNRIAQRNLRQRMRKRLEILQEMLSKSTESNADSSKPSFTDNDISHQSLEIKNTLADLVETLKLTNNSSGYLTATEDILDRFKVWIGDSAALHPASSSKSLEYRLLKSPKILHQICLHLHEILEALDDLIPVIQVTSHSSDDTFDVSPNLTSADFDNSSDLWNPLYVQDAITSEQHETKKRPVQEPDDSHSVSNTSASSGPRKSTNLTKLSVDLSIPNSEALSIPGRNASRRNRPLRPIIAEDPNKTIFIDHTHTMLAAPEAQRVNNPEKRATMLEAERTQWEADENDSIEEDFGLNVPVDVMKVDEVEVLLDAMSRSVKFLFRIGNFIAKTSLSDRHEEVRRSHDSESVTLFGRYLHNRYDKSTRSGNFRLAHRLAQALANRSQTIKSRLAKRARLDTVSRTTEDTPVVDPERVPSYSLPSSPKLSDMNSEEALEDDDSQLSALPIFGLKYPLELQDLATLSPHGRRFECPICLTVQRFHTDGAWMAHVYRDLQAYVCTYQSEWCLEEYFETRDSWFEHELQHRSTSRCILCNSTDNLAMHMESEHPSVSPEQRELIQKASVVIPAKFLATDCPFCDEWNDELKKRQASKSEISTSKDIPVSLAQFKRHVARHQERLALSTLSLLRAERAKQEEIVAGLQPAANIRPDIPKLNEEHRDIDDFPVHSSTAHNVQPYKTANLGKRIDAAKGDPPGEASGQDPIDLNRQRNEKWSTPNYVPTVSFDTPLPVRDSKRRGGPRNLRGGRLLGKDKPEGTTSSAAANRVAGRQESPDVAKGSNTDTPSSVNAGERKPRITGAHCPTCMSRGSIVWVVLNRACPQCGTQVF